MGTLSEDRLLQRVSASDLMPGELVQVITAMGNSVANGTVTAVYGTGAVQIRELRVAGAYGDRIYDSKLYGFVPIVPVGRGESEEHDGEILDEEPVQQAPSKAQAVDAKADQKAASMPSSEKGKAPTSSKGEVVSSHELDDVQMNRVISEISEAALRVLKAVGVKDIDVYSKVSEIQKVVSDKLKGSGNCGCKTKG
jgi:hypothetical protein